MTIVIDIGTLKLIGGFLAGIAAMLLAGVLFVAFGHWKIDIGWLNPARAAGFRRFFKLIFFPVLGIVATNAGSWLTAFLIHQQVSPDIANAGGLVVGAMVGGVHQGLSWTDATPAPYTQQPAYITPPVATQPLPSFGQQPVETPTPPQSGG